MPSDNDRPTPRGDRPPPHTPGPFDLASRTLLLDAAGNAVVGARDISAQALSVSVQLDGKKLVNCVSRRCRNCWAIWIARLLRRNCVMR